MKQRCVLVVGGCGYVGSHMVKALVEAGHRVVVLDNLSTGFRDALLGGELVVGDCGDRALVRSLLGAYPIEGVLHFAGSIAVGESVQRPLFYYDNNVGRSVALFEAISEAGPVPIVFSSSAAVYGAVDAPTIPEGHAMAPISPYGRTKAWVEQILRDCEGACGLRSISLRYFNAAGADPLGRIGERHDPETHLIPLAIASALGRGAPLRLFGRDYDTPDGTCIRDYVHVDDLAQAHLLALEALWAGAPTTAYNLGNGSGFSVLEVLSAVGEVSGRPVPFVDAPRRSGDPARLVADASRIRRELGWAPKWSDLRAIVEHAYLWASHGAR
jgi:UDP-glucose 4-epimerase